MAEHRPGRRLPESELGRPSAIMGPSMNSAAAVGVIAVVLSAGCAAQPLDVPTEACR